MLHESNPHYKSKVCKTACKRERKGGVLSIWLVRWVWCMVYICVRVRACVVEPGHVRAALLGPGSVTTGSVPASKWVCGCMERERERERERGREG